MKVEFAYIKSVSLFAPINQSSRVLIIKIMVIYGKVGILGGEFYLAELCTFITVLAVRW